MSRQFPDNRIWNGVFYSSNCIRCDEKIVEKKKVQMEAGNGTGESEMLQNLCFLFVEAAPSRKTIFVVSTINHNFFFWNFGPSTRLLSSARRLLFHFNCLCSYCWNGDCYLFYLIFQMKMLRRCTMLIRYQAYFKICDAIHFYIYVAYIVCSI